MILLKKCSKFRITYLLLFLCLFCNLSADEITGFWQTINKRTGKPNSVFAVYPYQGNYYARLIGIYEDDGQLKDTIYHPVRKTEGVKGHPYYSGLDIVWGAKPIGMDKFKGRVMDPRNGKVYDAVLWKQQGNLILRGQVFVFGRNEVWPPFPEENFNKNFKKPDISTFVPNIPPR